MDYQENLSEKDRYWLNIIQECRASGKSDYQWLQENNIAAPTFYYQVKQLRKRPVKFQAVMVPAKMKSRRVFLCSLRMMKALYFDKDGFCLLYKRLDSNGKFQWPRNPSEVRPLTRQEFRWLMEGLSIDQPKAIRPTNKKAKRSY